MATRTKTIQYAFPTYTSVVADITTTNLTQITLYIPETVTAFKSVTVDVGFQDVITATGGTITEHHVGLQLAAAGYSTITETDDITNSAENIGGVIGPFDYTSYFTTNWTGTNMTCDLQVYFSQSTGTTLGMRNVTAVVNITYEYDDDTSTNATQIKSVFIPLESLVGTLSTTANSNIGSNQIPILTGGSGILPEASVNIRDYYFLIEGNESNNNTTTDWTMTANIDSGTSFAFGVQEAALGSDRYGRWIYKPAVPTTTSAHNFQLWSSVTNKGNMMTITLVVTYEFDASSTTAVMNSIIMPLEFSSPIGVTTTAEASRFQRNIFVEEPSTITLRQSAFRVNFNTTASVAGLRWRAGGQAYRAYTHIANVVCGMFSVQQRIDSGSAQGAGFSLARGKNTITIDGYTTDTTDQLTNVMGYFIINYTSGVSSSGLGAHNHTIFMNLLQWDALLTDRTRVNGYSVAIPESEYWIVSAGFIFYQWVQTAGMAITFDVEAQSTEGKGAGYYDVYADAYQADNERSCSIVWMRGRDVFKRYPADTDTERLDIETARDYRLYTTTTTSNGLMSVITYHSNTFSVTGDITGSAGGTVEIRTYRSDTRELVNSTTRSGNGPYSFTWYDDTIQLYTEAYEDGTHYGRSISAVAGTSLDVALSRPIARSFA